MSEITNRPLELLDIPMLQRALDQDPYEHGETSDYTRDGTYSVVYEDDDGPIGVLRYTKTLRLFCTWCKNDDSRKNAAVTIQAIKDSVEKARSSGFTEIVFNTESPKLAKFCQEVLGFEESQGQYVKQIGKEN